MPERCTPGVVTICGPLSKDVSPLQVHNLENQRVVFFNDRFFKELAVSSLAFFIAALAPFVGAVVLVFVPLVIHYYHSKNGRATGLTMIVLSLLIVFISMNAINAYYNLPLIIILALSGVFMAEILKRNYSIEKTLCFSVASIFIMGTLVLLYQGFRLGVAPWNLIGTYIEKKIQYSINLYTAMKISSEQLTLIKDNIPEIVALITKIFPALFLVSLIFVVWVNLLAARFFFRKYELPFPDFGNLSNWKAPEKMVWYLIAAGGVLLLPDERAEFAGWNMLVVILFVYLLAGLSVISFFLKKSSVPAAFRYLIYFLIFAQQIITTLVVTAGLFDLWADFRKLNNKMEEDSAG
jgi:uncharacterized protein YybS (DUF2232 family)